jgi:hypothetical protein
MSEVILNPVQKKKEKNKGVISSAAQGVGVAKS